MAKSKGSPRNIIVVSDLHCGCRMGLCPHNVKLDGGAIYERSLFQTAVWECWRQFCEEWVPYVTKGEPWALVVNGDALDGVHHGATTQVSHNLEDQARIARATLAPMVERAAAYYHVRGTEAHVGKSAQEEERLARELGSIPDEQGSHARWEMWHPLEAEDGKERLVHFTHHISTSSSSTSEATAICRELVEMSVESGRWNRPMPDVIVRSHRHRYAQVQMAGARGLHIGCVTPGWQGKTPFTYKIAARTSMPQFGGICIRVGDEGLYVRHKVWSIG